MNVLIWGAPAAIILTLIAIDTLRDSARRRREDREWAEIRQFLEKETW